MQYLTQLTPAEISFIAKPYPYSLKEVAKMTFFHLVFKGVLCINREIKTNRRGEERVYEYVVLGASYDTYPAKPHEWLLLKFFNEEKYKNGILLRYFIRLIYKEAVASGKLMRKAPESPDMVSYLAYPRLARWLGWFIKLSNQGERHRTEIKKELINVKALFFQALKDERSKAFEIAMAIGGNLLFIHPFDSELGTLFNQEITTAINQSRIEYDADWWGDWESRNFDNLFDSFDSFDSDYSSAESDWSSGDGDWGDY